MDYQDFFHAFLRYTQNNLEYLMLSVIYLVIQIYHSMLEDILNLLLLYDIFMFFPSVINTKI